MIAVYCQEEALAKTLAGVLADLPLRLTSDPARFQQSIGDACCVVVALPNLADADWLVCIDRILGHPPRTELVLVTRFKPENAPALLNLRSVSRVVWEGDLEFGLRPAVVRVLGRHVLACPEKAVEDLMKAGIDLGGVLAILGSPRRPPVTVAGLAAATGLSERRFRYLWHRSISPSASPKQFLDWLLLGKALHLREFERSWVRVAGSLSVKIDTLRAISLRSTGLTLSELEGEGFESYNRRFADWWPSGITS